jgi:hypothetical protein
MGEDLWLPWDRQSWLVDQDRQAVHRRVLTRLAARSGGQVLHLWCFSIAAGHHRWMAATDEKVAQCVAHLRKLLDARPGTPELLHQATRSRLRRIIERAERRVARTPSLLDSIKPSRVPHEPQESSATVSPPRLSRLSSASVSCHRSSDLSPLVRQRVSIVPAIRPDRTSRAAQADGACPDTIRCIFRSFSEKARYAKLSRQIISRQGGRRERKGHG